MTSKTTTNDKILGYNTKLIELWGNSVYQYLLLAAITLVAVILRFYKLGEWSFWVDEVFTVRDALNGDLTWPSSSFILIRIVLNMLGTSEWSARLVPALIGVVSIPILYFPIRKLFGPAVALLSGLLLSVSPWHIFWSQNARFYALLLLLYSLTLFAFYFGLERDRPWYLLLSLFLLGLAAREALTALFLVPVLFAYLGLLIIIRFEKPKGLSLRILLPVLLLLVVYGLYQVFTIFYLGQHTDFFFFFNDFVGYPNTNPIRLLASVIYRLGIPLVCLALFGGIFLFLQKKRAGVLLLLGTLVPLLLLLVLCLFTFSVDRYIFTSLPCWIILAAVAVKELFFQAKGYGRVLALGVLVLLLADPLSQDVLYYNYQNGNRPNWKKAFFLVEQHRIKGDSFAATRPEVGTYYLGHEVEWVNSVDPADITDSDQRTWFVIDSNSEVDPAIQAWIQQNSELVDVLDVNLPGKSLDVRIYLYDPAAPTQKSLISLVPFQGDFDIIG